MFATVTWVLIAVVFVALVFDYTNGFHDAANAIATSIGTRALTPTVALGMAAILNVVGGLLFETHVADTITQIVTPDVASQVLVLASLLGAVFWNMITWVYGIPSSSSHALIGGLIGTALTASWRLGTIHWETVWDKVILPTFLSPVLGLLGSMMVTAILYRLVDSRGSLFERIWVRAASVVLLSAMFTFLTHLLVGAVLAKFGLSLPPWLWVLPGLLFAVWFLPRVIGKGPHDVNGNFRGLQTLSAGYMALEHGHNDAQKTMGIITLALVAEGHITREDGVPLWVKLACAIVIGAGTFSGGRRIIRTMGMKLVKLEAIDGFAAETVAASVIQVAGNWGMPISTTHAITASITGVGVAKRVNAVRWGLTAQILFAWVVTLPAAGVLSAICYVLLQSIT